MASFMRKSMKMWISHVEKREKKKPKHDVCNSHVEMYIFHVQIFCHMRNKRIRMWHHIFIVFWKVKISAHMYK